MDALTVNTHYHIFNHANGNENLFKEPENYRYFLQQYEKHLSPVVDTLAYCLMPNHFHLVVKTKSKEEIERLFSKIATDLPKSIDLPTSSSIDLPTSSSIDLPTSSIDLPTSSIDLPGFENLEGLLEEESKTNSLEGLVSKYISKQFSNFFNSYSKAFNKKYNRRGSLFIKNFKRKPIYTQSHLTTVILYVHNNPIHHRFTQQMTDWQWSSYHSIADQHQQLVATTALLQLFGNRDEFEAAHLRAAQDKKNQLMQEYEE